MNDVDRTHIPARLGAEGVDLGPNVRLFRTEFRGAAWASQDTIERLTEAAA